MLKDLIKKYQHKLDTSGKVTLKIKVSTKMPKTEFTNQLDDGTLKLNVKSAPEKGKANKEIIKYLSKQFEIPKSKIKILSGETSSLKIISIERQKN
ncbi:MAG: uncharacterized protein PWQ82_208 [Thermosediminibacterales bacterium]|nr:uncharacterized protein [Thermosediminibacterales bacterium]MDK2835230.1 uncharacterized protein [Thermosediminibacterales bacterium]